MANIFVDHTASGANNGTSWTDAYTSLASTTSAAAGDEIRVDDGHSQSAGSTTWNWSNGTLGNPVKIFCVDKNNSDALSTGATFSFSAAATWQGNIRVHGLTITSSAGGLSIGTGTDNVQEWTNLTLTLTASSITLGGTGAIIKLIEPTISIASAAAASSISISTRAEVYIFLGSIALRTLGTNDAFLVNDRSNLRCFGVTFSNTCTDFIGAGSVSAKVSVVRCILPTLTNWVGSTPTHGAFKLYVERCTTSAPSVAQLGLTRYEDAYGVVASSLSRYRTGGADDGVQANPHSWEMVTNGTNVKEQFCPLSPPPIVLWIPPHSSPSSPTSKGKVHSTRMALRGTPAALTTDSGSTWNGSGVSTKQKIDVSLSNGQTLTVYVASGVTLNNDDFWIDVEESDQLGGPILIYPSLSLPSATVYLDVKGYSA